MLPPGPTDWPFHYIEDIWRNPRLNTPAPQRHEIALERYLEQQRARRLSATPIVDLRRVAGRLFRLAARIANAPVSVLWEKKRSVATTPSIPPA
ncbi:hypothetical protein ACWGS9_22670 [Bradyrhizobium sp. Arg314]